ncbi:MAG: calcium/sodium antiporter [Verrucomicrobiota bacterium JB022]|nr:calcium/sodium antiporter [Verrucomicrobiota bacterium JB022]
MDTLLVPILILIASLALLWFGAEGLVRGGAALVVRLGLTPLVVGLTVVAYGTSMPELLVSTRASLAGQGDIALGNVVGSNIFNICIILGLAAVIQPLKVQRQLMKLDVPVMLAASFLFIPLFWDGVITRFEAGVFLVGLVAYTGINIYLARKESATVQTEAMEVPLKKGSVPLEIAYLIGGLLVLVVGSHLLVDSSVTIARHLGLSEAVIGLTIVAAGTSMPELATSVVAALRRQADIAIGNVVGSNIYNLLGIVGVSGAIIPLRGPGLQPVDLAVMAGSTLLLLPLMRTGFLIRRWEGALLLAVYAGYLWWLWPDPAAVPAA